MTRELYQKKKFAAGTKPQYWDDVIKDNAAIKKRVRPTERKKVRDLWGKIEGAGPMNYIEYLQRFGLDTIQLDYAIAGEVDPALLAQKTGDKRYRGDAKLFDWKKKKKGHDEYDPTYKWAPPAEWDTHRTFEDEWKAKQAGPKPRIARTGYEKLRYYEKHFKFLPHVADLFVDALATLHSSEYKGSRVGKTRADVEREQRRYKPSGRS